MCYGQVVIDSDGNCYTYNSDGTIGGINIEDTVTISGDYEKVVYTYDSNGNVTQIEGTQGWNTRGTQGDGSLVLTND